MSSRYETSIYTKEQLENARTRSRLVGWLQGGLVTAGGFMLLKLLGWIPLLLLAAAAGYAGYRLFRKGRSVQDAMD